MNVKCLTTFPPLSTILAALLFSAHVTHVTDAPEVEADTDQADKPAGSGNQVYVGRQKHYNTYKQLLQAQRAQMAQASAPESAQPTFTEETAGSNHILVDEFDGFKRWELTPGSL